MGQVFVFGSAATFVAAGRTTRPPRDIDVGYVAVSPTEAERLGWDWAEREGLTGLPLDVHPLEEVPFPAGAQAPAVFPLMGETPRCVEVTSLHALLRLSETAPEKALSGILAAGRAAPTRQRHFGEEGTLQLFYEPQSQTLGPGVYQGQGILALGRAYQHAPIELTASLGEFGAFLREVARKGALSEVAVARLRERVGDAVNGERVFFALSPSDVWSAVARGTGRQFSFGELLKLMYDE